MINDHLYQEMQNCVKEGMRKLNTSLHAEPEWNHLEKLNPRS